MAEASGSRTHLRRANPPHAGFEDREDHRTPCASALVQIKWVGTMLTNGQGASGAPLKSSVGLTRPCTGMQSADLQSHSSKKRLGGPPARYGTFQHLHRCKKA